MSFAISKALPRGLGLSPLSPLRFATWKRFFFSFFPLYFSYTIFDFLDYLRYFILFFGWEWRKPNSIPLFLISRSKICIGPIFLSGQTRLSSVIVILSNGELGRFILMLLVTSYLWLDCVEIESSNVSLWRHFTIVDRLYLLSCKAAGILYWSNWNLFVRIFSSCLIVAKQIHSFPAIQWSFVIFKTIVW